MVWYVQILVSKTTTGFIFSYVALDVPNQTSHGINAVHPIPLNLSVDYHPIFKQPVIWRLLMVQILARN